MHSTRSLSSFLNVIFETVPVFDDDDDDDDDDGPPMSFQGTLSYTSSFLSPPADQ